MHQLLHLELCQRVGPRVASVGLLVGHRQLLGRVVWQAGADGAWLGLELGLGLDYRVRVGVEVMGLGLGLGLWGRGWGWGWGYRCCWR